MLLGLGVGGAQSAVDLPSSKQLLLPVPGGAQRLNSLPMSLAVSPDGRWVVSLNAGYGTYESGYAQSLAVMDTQTGAVKDFPDARVGERAAQTFFSGLAFSADGTKVYASMASSSAPVGDGDEEDWERDRGVRVCRWCADSARVYEAADGEAGGWAKDGLSRIPMAGRWGFRIRRRLRWCRERSERLLVAENLSDSVALMDAASGEIERTFDVGESEDVPSTYPIALAVTKDGRRAFVALWNASEVVELDLGSGKVVRKVALLKPKSAIAPGTHPCALLLDERAGVMYVALSNRDAVAAVSIGRAGAPELAVRGYFDTRLPGQSYFGAEPVSLAMNAERTRLYAANLGSDAVAVLDPRRLTEVSSEG